MKRRNDFVTNSSSSSFIIAKSALTKDQIYKIYDYKKLAASVLGEQEGLYANDDFSVWEINEDEDYIEGNTIMDNFDMQSYLLAIGIPDEKIKMRYS